MPDDVVKSDTAKREEEILAFWNEHQIFKKSLEKPSPKGEFVFYEGPPTANAAPALHHLESRAFKDIIPRYKTMRGYHVRRRAGWDTHGLPVELQIEKELGFSGKPDIEKFGVEAFNEKCRESVYRYINEWSRFTERIGYWVDREEAYYTLNASYMESLWSIFKNVHDAGRLYKDYKVLPWCSRCGTALSSHELAQGYEDVKDLSLTVKFKVKSPEKHNLPPETYLLAWTTTPWTLPGNVALAVGQNINYVLAKELLEVSQTVGSGTYSPLPRDESVYLVAKDLYGNFKLSPPQKEIAGSALIGIEYEPLYPYAETLAPESEREAFTRAYKVYGADFVTTEDGTGIVHTAVMYGQDDFELGKKIGLPKVHLVNPEGTFIAGTGFLEGRFVRDEAVSVDILKDLTEKGNFFAKEKHEHSYPFCWRCKTPLIYYARDSWYFRMADLRDTLVAENKKVHWEPSHIREGRMGEWVANVKDWAISRERYWGTPLPVWESSDGSERVVVGSVADLKKYSKKSNNRYFFMRHGQSESNVASRASTLAEAENHVTELGVAQIKKATESLKKTSFDVIIASPIMRARETAEQVAEALGYPKENIVIDARMREIEVGEFEGKSNKEYHQFFDWNYDTMFERRPKGGENFVDMKHRIGEFLYELEQKYQGKTILVVAHEYSIWMAEAIVQGANQKETIAMKVERPEYYENAEVKEVPFVPLPHNKNYELDLHRPYIDDVVLISEKGTHLKRIKEVADVWFDSGSMPFAQDHYPFENTSWVQGKGYPADFISEAIDQTRGWFYTLLAVGVLMGRGVPYKNVVCLGHLLDAEGKKMSKSKGNIINPWDAMATYGVDTLRFWMYSVNAPGDSKSFDEKTVREAGRALSWFENSAKFFELSKNETRVAAKKQLIDVWMEERTRQTVEEVARFLDEYSVHLAARSLVGLFEDLSQWYVRRIRDRVKAGDQAALETLQNTLHISARLLAPFAPFLAEQVFSVVKKEHDPESVHLTKWPSERTFRVGLETLLFKSPRQLLSDMYIVRSSVSEALKVRQQLNIKVRQPLASLSLKSERLKNKNEFLALIKDELNVKEVAFNPAQEGEVVLDTTITAELKEEGEVRELMRAIQDLRKAKNLSPKDKVVLTYAGDTALLEKYWADISKTTNVERFEKGEVLNVEKL